LKPTESPMLGVTFLGDRKLAPREFPDPAPRDVVLEIKASGMCGSDLHVYRASFKARSWLSLRTGLSLKMTLNDAGKRQAQIATEWPSLECTPAILQVFTVVATWTSVRIGRLLLPEHLLSELLDHCQCHRNGFARATLMDDMSVARW